jgi:hypothetical protein
MRKILLSLIFLGSFSCVAVAQSASKSDNPLQSELAQFSGWLGEWRCDGKFLKSGAPIASTVRFSPALQGRWIEMQQDDLPPNRFHALEFWGYSTKTETFTANVFDNFSESSRVFEAKPMSHGVLTWNRDVSGAGATRAEQFIFENADGKLKITYQVMRSGSWAVGDVLNCTRQ